LSKVRLPLSPSSPPLAFNQPGDENTDKILLDLIGSLLSFFLAGRSGVSCGQEPESLLICSRHTQANPQVGKFGCGFVYVVS
jgi:hypothetical protein